MELKKQRFPRWLFVVIAVGGLLASGLFLGILSVEGATTARILQTAGFGLLGLVMLWGALNGQ